jgi:single-strand DNA-binding protein
MNSLNAIGYLARDAETRFTPKGDPVISFSIALKSGYGEHEKTTWLSCSAFGKRYENLAQYLIKGTQVGVQGEISLDTYTGKDGLEKTSLNVRVGDITLLGKSTQREPQTAEPQKQKPINSMDDIDDEVPF